MDRATGGRGQMAKIMYSRSGGSLVPHIAGVLGYWGTAHRLLSDFPVLCALEFSSAEFLSKDYPNIAHKKNIR